MEPSHRNGRPSFGYGTVPWGHPSQSKPHTILPSRFSIRSGTGISTRESAKIPKCALQYTKCNNTRGFDAVDTNMLVAQCRKPAEVFVIPVSARVLITHKISIDVGEPPRNSTNRPEPGVGIQTFFFWGRFGHFPGSCAVYIDVGNSHSFLFNSLFSANLPARPLWLFER